MCTLSNMPQKSLPTLPVDPAAVSGQQHTSIGPHFLSAAATAPAADASSARQDPFAHIKWFVCVSFAVCASDASSSSAHSRVQIASGCARHAKKNTRKTITLSILSVSLQFASSPSTPAQFEKARATKVNNRIDNCVYFNM